ncbi:hypothetical protein ACJ5H2_22250 (plasmid) [Nocardioides sp. R1-1]|uniref:phosphotriesterase family protein n=1 Tax=Nocardioides sp. R1-1 TaxID=3383502 RepID=UPI0038D0AC0D
MLGLVDPDELGHVMMHEHIGRPTGGDDQPRPVHFREPEDPLGKSYAHKPVSLENLWWVRYNFRDSLDNLTRAPWPVWETEVQRYAEAGGGTLCEVSAANTLDLDRLAAISRATGVHIVAGAGFYHDGSYPSHFDVPGSTVEALAQIMIDAIVVGDKEGNRCGMLGEIGCSWPLTDNERRVLLAAAIAQRATGVAMSIHPGRNDAALAGIRDVLVEGGADLSRVVMGHMDRCGYSLPARRDILDSGMVIEYDVFGMEGHYPADVAFADGAMPDMPNDTGRIKQIGELVSLGYADQLVVGHDIHMKFQMTSYGGYGYGHFLRTVLPLFEVWEVPVDAVRKLTLDTPHRLLTLVGRED